MTIFVVDVESDGPIPGDYSMISFGAVVLDESLEHTFYGRMKPISDQWIPEALAVSGFNRQETLEFPTPEKTMNEFTQWIAEHARSRPLFFSDNNGFDWQFINWYFIHFTGSNPFGFSSTNIGSLYKGMVGDMFKNFKHLRKTKHTHHPVDDAKGNAEALLYMKKEMGLKISLK
ncbi:3'-5' exoribonuclease [Pleionea sp. CnH1-48]|uniref:3'-5' exoribonuclease n=1 Tax=Pleionea sp. CnH1-48 TaxID=2954494 RepID=UPI00209775EF|nr:3'-5' exoribonuclease [Pleionea sp. CnH1-48]MCO7226527.1 3'-5' exoribonuclease [Pleionea sp. CnH1-48]